MSYDWGEVGLYFQSLCSPSSVSMVTYSSANGKHSLLIQKCIYNSLRIITTFWTYTWFNKKGEDADI